jgi:hypothetical protein
MIYYDNNQSDPVTYIKQHFQPVVRVYYFTILKYKKNKYYYAYAISVNWTLQSV